MVLRIIITRSFMSRRWFFNNNVDHRNLMTAMTGKENQPHGHAKGPCPWI